MAARMTPSAVPYPHVASAPALQWVSTVPSIGSSAAPCAPIRLQAAMSSSYICRAFATTAALIFGIGVLAAASEL